MFSSHLLLWCVTVSGCDAQVVLTLLRWWLRWWDDVGRDAPNQVGKGHAGRAAKCLTKKEALAVAQEGIEAVERVYAKVWVAAI